MLELHKDRSSDVVLTRRATPSSVRAGGRFVRRSDNQFVDMLPALFCERT